MSEQKTQSAAKNRAAKILRCKEVLLRTGLSRATIYRLVAKGWFPSPVKLSKTAVGWIEAEVEDWLSSRERAAASASRH